MIYKEGIVQMLEGDIGDSNQNGDNTMPMKLNIAVKHTGIYKDQFLAKALLVLLIGLSLYLAPFSNWEKFLLNKVYILGIGAFAFIAAVIFMYYSVGIINPPLVQSSVPKRRVRSKVFNVEMRRIQHDIDST